MEIKNLEEGISKAIRESTKEVFFDYAYDGSKG
jgi:hypothetical protein